MKEDHHVLSGIDKSISFFSEAFKETTEQLAVAHVADNLQCLSSSIYPLSSDATAFPVREIMLESIRFKSSGIIIARKNIVCSAQRRKIVLTELRKLTEAAEIMDVTVLDYLELVGERWTSFRQLGFL